MPHLCNLYLHEQELQKNTLEKDRREVQMSVFTVQLQHCQTHLKTTFNLEANRGTVKMLADLVWWKLQVPCVQ